MFCSNCGMTIEENSKFCKHCGFQMHTLDTEEKKVSVSQKNLPQTVGNTELNRDALLLYLQNVRDLEVAKSILLRQKNQKENEYSAKYNELSRKPYVKEYPDFHGNTSGKWSGFLLIAIMLFFIWLFCLWLERVMPGEPGPVFITISGIGWIVFAIMSIISYISTKTNYNAEWKYYLKQCEGIDEENEKRAKEAEVNRKNRLPVVVRQWEKYCNEQNEKIDKVDTLLASFYDMNIIAKEYRNNLAAVQYIYEVAESTHLSYEQICLHTKMEDGIRRIESGLAEIINSVERLIYETRLLREEQNQNAQMIMEQNNKMLRNLQQTEKNSELTSQYAQLAANYAEANAYFSLATYLFKD